MILIIRSFIKAIYHGINYNRGSHYLTLFSIVAVWVNGTNYFLPSDHLGVSSPQDCRIKLVILLVLLCLVLPIVFHYAVLLVHEVPADSTTLTYCLLRIILDVVWLVVSGAISGLICVYIIPHNSPDSSSASQTSPDVTP